MSESAPRPEELSDEARLAAEAAVAPEEDAARADAEVAASDASAEAAVVVAPESEAAAAVEPAEAVRATPSPADVAALAAKKRRDRRDAEAEPAEVRADDDKDKAGGEPAEAEPAAEAADTSAKKLADELATSLGFADADALLHNFDQMRAALANPKQRKMAERMLRDSDAKYQKAFAAYDADRGAAEAAPAPAESEAESRAEAADEDESEPTTETSEQKITRLEAENAALKVEVAGLRDEVARLTDEVTKLREAIEAAGLIDPTRRPAPETGDEGDASRRRTTGEAEHIYDKLHPEILGFARERMRVHRATISRIEEDMLTLLPADQIVDTLGRLRSAADEDAVKYAIDMGNVHGTYAKWLAKQEAAVRRGEVAPDDHEGDDSEEAPATAEEREAARSRLRAEMAGEDVDDEDEADDISEGGLRARLKRIFSRGRRTEEAEEPDEDTDDEGDDSEEAPATAEERERARDRFRRRMAGRAASAALLFNLMRGPEGESEPDEVRPAYARRGGEEPDEELPPYARRS